MIIARRNFIILKEGKKFLPVAAQPFQDSCNILVPGALADELV